MTDETRNRENWPDAIEWSRDMARIAERSQSLVTEFLARQAENGQETASALGHGDALSIGRAFLEMTQSIMTNPQKIVEAQMNLWKEYMELWQSTTRRMMGEEAEPVVEPERGDRRFKDEVWNQNAIFDYIKQSYLLTSRWMQETVKDMDGLDNSTAKKVDFYTRQFADAMAPTNFLMTNPEVIRTTIDSRGENLVKGLENLLDDLEKGKGELHISMTDTKAFEVGKNIATTPGSVIFQNDLMQLIQYAPTTEKVHKRPLLIIPPWINKFYILDLKPENSFIRWAVDQGHTVFVISWVNPDSTLAGKRFEDYMTEGPIAALDVIENITGEKDANVIGYCLGGTLLAATLAWLTAEKKEARVASATFFTTMIDFTDAGELSVFIDEAQLDALEHRMEERGYLDGRAMATTFNMLRANDLIWSFVVSNYMLGKEPLPFDLLYWNSDSTRMPARMHSFYLRKMYLENKLIEPGGIELAGHRIDLTKIKTPTFVLSTREDHIAPWKSTYAATRTYKGKVKFVLAGSGHIAGVVNPPSKEKYGYWTNPKNLETPDAWLSSAKENKGSWWPEWEKWVNAFSNGECPARIPGEGKLKAIEPAPGSYVKVRSDE